MAKDAKIGMFDLAWMGSMIVRPGRHNYFIIYKYDATRIFQTDVKSLDVQPRSISMHHHVLPKTKLEIDAKKGQTKKEDNYYFNIFNQWKLDTD
jgi:hypothetical protein